MPIVKEFVMGVFGNFSPAPVLMNWPEAPEASILGKNWRRDVGNFIIILPPLAGGS